MGYVYRHWDKSGSLLYIGSTSNFGRRTNAHLYGPWGAEISKVGIEIYDSISDAKVAEASAILNENPKYNSHHSIETNGRQKLKKRSDRYQSKLHPLVSEAIKRCGGTTKFIDTIGISRQALSQWGSSIPEMRVAQIEALIERLPEKKDPFALIRRVRKEDRKKPQKKPVLASSGVKGVIYNKRSKKWAAYSRANGERIYLGMHDSIDSAKAAIEKFKDNVGGS